MVADALAPHREALDALWASRGGRGSAADQQAAVAEIATALQPLLRQAASAALHRLYPDAREIPEIGAEGGSGDADETHPGGAALRESVQAGPAASR